MLEITFVEHSPDFRDFAMFKPGVFCQPEVVPEKQQLVGRAVDLFPLTPALSRRRGETAGWPLKPRSFPPFERLANRPPSPQGRGLG